MPEFKDMLKYYRERAGLSQREFASRMNIAPATVGMYEQGKRHPDFETEEKIADFFNVSLDNLRGREDESKPSNTLIISEDIHTLVSNYNLLNKNGKVKAQEYIADLTEQSKYTADDTALKREA